MLRKLLAFYFVPNGPITTRDTVLKIILPIAAVFTLAQIFPAQKMYIALVFWPIVLLVLISRAAVGLLERKRDLQTEFDNDRPKLLWLHKLIAVMITITGFAMGVATAWAIPIAIFGLTYAATVEGLRLRASRSRSRPR